MIEANKYIEWYLLHREAWMWVIYIMFSYLNTMKEYSVYFQCTANVVSIDDSINQFWYNSFNNRLTAVSSLG